MSKNETPAPLVEVFSGPQCSYCTRAKALLSSKGIAYQEYDVSASDNRASMQQRLPRARSIPQIFINGEHIGGCDDLESLNAQGRLDAMVGLEARS